MKIALKRYKVYSFSELSKEAKEVVKQWYLDDPSRNIIFSDMLSEDIHNIFPNSELKIQYSLYSCQGDGINVYGILHINDVISMPGTGRAPELDWIKDNLTEKEIKTIYFYMNRYKDYIKIPINRHYNYCMADYIDFVEDFQYELEDMGIRNVNTNVLDKLEHIIKQVFQQLCSNYEKMGYSYFYEISDEDMKEICDDNNWYFLKSGKYFNRKE